MKFFVTSLILATQLFFVQTQLALGANAATFEAGNIIDNSTFFNKGTMTVSDIQNFLNSKVRTCDTNHAPGSGSQGESPPWRCLKDYFENPTTHANNLDGRPRPSGSISAAQIIYNAAQKYSINPQVLIVLLQKEQGLVTDTWPYDWQYKTATGYGCPDGAPCNSEYFGFYNQVFKAAFQFRRYATFPSEYNFRAGVNNNILYRPGPSSCGSKSVFIANQATAGLYNYTPYTPNQAALNNLYGTGDGCSSYGNRNFWRDFSDWFGPTAGGATAKHPDGTLVQIPGQNAVFIINGSERRQILSPAVMKSHRFSWSEIKVATDGDTQLSIGDPISFREGSLLKGTANTIYIADEQVDGSIRKRAFANWAAFSGLGFSLNEVIRIDDDELPSDDGPEVNTSSRHPDGVLVRASNDNKVWKIAGGRLHIPSPGVLIANNYGWGDIKLAKNGDMDLNEGTLGFREGVLLQGSTKDVFVTENNQKRLIPDQRTFRSFGYFSREIQKVKDSELPSSNGAVVTSH